MILTRIEEAKTKPNNKVRNKLLVGPIHLLCECSPETPPNQRRAKARTHSFFVICKDSLMSLVWHQDLSGTRRNSFKIRSGLMYYVESSKLKYQMYTKNIPLRKKSSLRKPTIFNKIDSECTKRRVFFLPMLQQSQDSTRRMGGPTKRSRKQQRNKQ